LFVNILGAIALVVSGTVHAIWLGLGAVGIVFALLISNATPAILGITISVRFAHVKVSAGPLSGTAAAPGGLDSCLPVPLLTLPEIPRLL